MAKQGVETNDWFKEALAQYLDEPEGKKVCLIRKALSNISDRVLHIADGVSNIFVGELF